MGVVTGKSVGLKPRDGYREPIFLSYMPMGFMNAVGLTNPGAQAYRDEIRRVGFPQDKVLMGSVFGGSLDEFVQVVEIMDDVVDAHEGNFSCPHVAGHGMAMGQDPDLVYAITRAVVDKTRKPFFAKLTPNTNNIAAIAKAAMRGGAYGITAINTVGPGYFSHDGHPVLTNKVGGISGRGILPMGLKVVREIRDACPYAPIKAEGGIAIARDILQYLDAGATFCSLGSCATGMTDGDLIGYVDTLFIDMDSGANNAEYCLKDVSTKYQKVKITGVERYDCDFKSVTTDANVKAGPGQFVFAWIPGVGEKPFSLVHASPLTLGVLERGPFTKEFNQLQPGDSFYVRGPYGQAVEPSGDVVVVGGGCGIAGIVLAAHQGNVKGKVTALLAARDTHHIPYQHELERVADVHIATEDGSLGEKGLVTALFDKVSLRQGCTFYNCGPKKMLDAILPLELKVTSADKIYSSLDYMTRCGLGICGSCADEKGRRTCVEGPFMRADG
jgi:dihydroorotate dehydrogenase (NAD+) catalytic subunit